MHAHTQVCTHTSMHARSLARSLGGTRGTHSHHARLACGASAGEAAEAGDFRCVQDGERMIHMGDEPYEPQIFAP